MKTTIALTLASTLALAACSDSKFKGGVTTAKPAPATPPPVVEAETENVEKKETVLKKLELKTSSTSSPIDMIWVVDNSGSMAEEVAQVRANIQKFVGSISKSADLRLSFISNTDQRLGLQFDEMNIGADFLHVKSYVGSWNLMSILASALCEKSTTSATNDVVDKICGKAVVSTKENDGIFKEPFASRQVAVENSDLQALAVAGSLSDRMRPGAVRVYVFVTDDIAKGAVSDKNFMELTTPAAKDKNTPSSTHSYAFAGIAKDSCKIAEVGTTYTALSSATGGEVFDICATDWSANFSKLTENVIKLTSSVFDIPADIVALKNVKIKGKQLTKQQYAYAKGKLVIIDKTLLAEGDTVNVEYEVEE